MNCSRGLVREWMYSFLFFSRQYFQEVRNLCCPGVVFFYSITVNTGREVGAWQGLQLAFALAPRYLSCQGTSVSDPWSRMFPGKCPGPRIFWSHPLDTDAKLWLQVERKDSNTVCSREWLGISTSLSFQSQKNNLSPRIIN